MDTTRNRLIEILSANEDDYISGQELSKRLGISRNSVWKHIKALKKDGYVIEGVTRKGYRIIEQPDKVSENTIKWGLQTKWLGQTIIHKREGASTQLLIHEAAQEGADHGTVAILDKQTEGKGRLNRKWQSLEYKGMWLSILLRPEILPQQAPQLTLLTATVVADLLKEDFALEPMIKWPNDVLLQKKKVAGILTEMQAEQDRIQYIVLGIGLNINHTEKDLPETTNYQATSLFLETGKKRRIQSIIRQFLNRFEKAYEDYMENGFPPIRKKWESYSLKLGKTIRIKTPEEEKDVLFHGIAGDGALVIIDHSGQKENIYSAEIDWF